MNEQIGDNRHVSKFLDMYEYTYGSICRGMYSGKC